MYGQSKLVFEYNPKPVTLLPPADPALLRGNDVPKELFVLERAEIEEAYVKPSIPVEEVLGEEPEHGTEPDWFDKHNYELTRFSKNYAGRIPHFLKRNVPSLRPPEAIKAHEKVVGLDQIPAGLISPGNITYLCLADVKLPKKQLKNLHKSLAPFINMEVLLLRGLGLTSLKSCKYPNLRFLDLSNNAFDRVQSVVSFIKHSPNLDVINMMYNPCAPREDLIGRMLSVCIFLSVVNEKELSVAERIHALELYGPKAMKPELPWLRWDMALDLIPEIAHMRFSNKGWDPSRIVAISLPNCGLTNFSVSSMPNLQTLDLSNNQISDLRNTGIEQCSQLAWIVLKHNLIAKMKSNFEVLAQVCNLHSVFFEGNQIVLNKNFRSKLIYATRYLRGTNRSLGLQEIDGNGIAIEERVAAVEMWGDKQNPREETQVVRWDLNLILLYGHHRVKDHLAIVRACVLPRMNLGYANLAGFADLQYLDLSWNNLSDIVNLDRLEMLRVVDFSENPRLKTSRVLKQLEKCTHLEHFSFFVQSVADHKRTPRNRSYRERVLRAILFPNKRLKSVDNIPIGREERIEAYGFSGLSEDIDMDLYRFHLALTLNCCTNINSGGQDHRLHPNDVGIGAQYEPSSITGLRRLPHCGLVSRVCNFSAFVNLVELDISYNRLVDIANIGLRGHRNLRVLCATNNSISTPMEQIADLLDSIPHLEAVCLRENPIMRTADDRAKLLGLLTSQRVFLPNLRTLDTIITLSERIDAWKRITGEEDEPERMRFVVVFQSLLLAQPLMNPAMLTVLDLSYADLKFVVLSECPNLRQLILVGNRVESLDSCVGLSNLTQLLLLDVRYNLIQKLESVAAMVNNFPLLETLGVIGNKCAPASSGHISLRDIATTQPSHRVKLLSLIPDALRVRGHSLAVIDSKEITIEERAQACKANAPTLALIDSSFPNMQQERHTDRRNSTFSGFGSVANLLTLRKGSLGSSSQSNMGDAKLLCWPMALLRKLPPTLPYVAITEADFSSCSLTNIDLSVLPSLVKLSLANNNLRESQFEQSNVAMLGDLRSLDLRANQLKKLGPTCEVISKIPRLDTLWIEGNPCYPSESSAMRVNFFKKIRRGDLLLASLNGNAVMPPDLVKLGMSKRGFFSSNAENDDD